MGDGVRAVMDEIGVASLVSFRFVVAMLRGGSAAQQIFCVMSVVGFISSAWVPSARHSE